ncbi:Two component regulator three Y domain-containing protein [Chryseobacterium lactis]|uniref:Two component regulator three Y domain-containing protein n=1 Tax=Chryseobacterium lactis TaxID=1241981 RepID=A0A3G6RNY4_CHRLC|nr:Two component regulator three Y domain-containing protein [Chryseobacterium lactis]AZA81627.1 Two component regulator three Y domain-containing protein [Chryseobacterium lactis]AZB06625.1 Two component regulator three Y domain-containing protein [Chryseobacterium lactis]PNW15476.1 Two component regulator three Y domain-containing protein [Chryseobacterium lactis]
MIYKFFFKMINAEAEKIDDDFESNYVNLINRYLLLLFFIFLFYSIVIITLFGDLFISTFLTVITFFFLFLMAIKGKTRRFTNVLKTVIISIFVLLTFIVSFFNIYTYKNAGVEYFYFCLLFAVPFFLNYKKDSFSILFIAFIISINFIVCVYFDFDFLPKSRFLEKDDFKIIRLWNILFSIASFLMDIVFITQKDELIKGLIVEQKMKDSTIKDLVKTNTELMKHQMLINHLTEENIREILSLAETNSPIFFEKFQIFFPHFIPEILKINPNLIHSELYFCALMKLDFDTKKIAQCTNNSIRAVESKKYRIRKKLNVSSEININSFLIKV